MKNFNKLRLFLVVFVLVCSVFILKPAEIKGAEPGLFFANASNTKACIAIIYYQPYSSSTSEAWITEGWWCIGPSETARVLSGLGGNRYYYYLAIDSNGDMWGEAVVQAEVCFAKFTHKEYVESGDDTWEGCERSESRVVPFAMVDVNGYDSYTLNLR